MGGYTRKGVVYQGPTLKRGRKAKVVAIVPAKTAKVSKTVKKAINRAINNKLETKCAVREVFNRVAVPGAGLDTANGLGLGTTTGIIPLISRGTDDASRTGDMLHVKRLVLKFSIRARNITVNSPAGNNPYRQPFMVRMIVFNHRFAIDEASATNILDKGASSGNLDSSPDSWLEPYQKKEYKIWFSKTFKMSPLLNDVNIPATIENMPNGYQTFVGGRKSIKIPKKLLYNGAATLPTNSMPQLCFAVCNVDGTPVSNTQFRCEVNVESQLYYTDA